MRVKVMVLEEKEYNGKDILFPTELEIETKDINVLSQGSKTIGYDKQLLRLTNNSFKALKKSLIKTKEYERLMVL